MPFVIRNPIAGNQQINMASEWMQHPLGTELQAWDSILGEGTFVYGQGFVGCVAGSLVAYNPATNVMKAAAAGDLGPVAVAMAPTSGTQFGWFQRTGQAVVQIAGSVAANAPAYIATAGKAGSTVVAGSRMQNAKFAAVSSGPTAMLGLDFPFVTASQPD